MGTRLKVMDQAKPQLVFHRDPGTLVDHGMDTAYLRQLYNAHGDDLRRVCERMAVARAAMTRRGFGADFSDCEAELLYLLVRDMEPDCVVEISPKHGYSTNYILSALADNGKGRLFSYEIVREFQGRGIEEVITGNLIADANPARLEIVVGDVRDADIPDPDLLFLDSCHEAHFAAWYFRTLVPRAGLCFVHDIAWFNPAYGTIVPKAALMGMREPYYVLQTLHANGQQMFPVADFSSRTGGDGTPDLPVRFASPVSGPSDRAVLFPGHAQSDAAGHAHADQERLHSLAIRCLEGDRVGVLADIANLLADPAATRFAKLQAVNLYGLLGLRHPYGQADGLDWPAVSSEGPTVSVFAGFLEAALNTCDREALSAALDGEAPRGIDPDCVRYLRDCYRSMAGLNDGHGARSLWERAASWTGLVRALAGEPGPGR